MIDAHRPLTVCDSGTTIGDWPLLEEWSVDRASTGFSAQAARRLLGSGASAQPVAPSPRIHEMDRKCARALPGIAKLSAPDWHEGVYARSMAVDGGHFSGANWRD